MEILPEAKLFIYFWLEYFAALDLLPSEWSGNYTCSDDNITHVFAMNISRSDNINTAGSVLIYGQSFNMSGAFAFSFNLLTLQSDSSLHGEVAGRNFTSVELDGRLWNPALIQGFVVFMLQTGPKLSCPVELTRVSGIIFLFLLKLLKQVSLELQISFCNYCLFLLLTLYSVEMTCVTWAASVNPDQPAHLCHLIKISLFAFKFN
jgi:hypothetical protein